MAWSGQLKQLYGVPTLSADLTLILTYSTVLFGLTWCYLTGSIGRIRPWSIALFLFAMGLAGTLNPVSSVYASEKTARFFVVTLPAVLATASLIRSSRDALKFVYALLGVAFVLSVSIAVSEVSSDTEMTGRLTTSFGASITFAQAAGVVIAGVVAWVLTARRLQPAAIAIAGVITIFEFWVLLSIGSRGPVLALLIATCAMAAAQIGSPIAWMSLRVGSAVAFFLGALVLVWSSVPGLSRDRLLLLGSGTSAELRTLAWSFTWSSLDGSVFGGGWGAWPIRAQLPIRYPHNIFLEVWYEAGLAGLTMLAVAILLSLDRQVRCLSLDRGTSTILIGLVVYWLAAAQVSSDVNNKLLFLIVVAASAPYVSGRITDTRRSRQRSALGYPGGGRSDSPRSRERNNPSTSVY